MATFVFTDAFVSINAVDLSDHVKSVTLSYSAELQDDTAMGDDTRSRLGGLKDWNAAIEFHQDYAASNVDDTLFPLVGTSFAVIIRPVKGTVVGPTNPNYTGTGIMESYTPVAGAVGEIPAAPISIQAAGTLTRAVA